MHGEKHNVFRRAEDQNGDAQERSFRQTERTDPLLFDQSAGLQLALSFGVMSQVHGGEFDSQDAGDDLDELSVDDGESGSQRFVSPHNLVETLFQRRQIERTGNPNYDRDVESSTCRFALI